jgi:hypothetical protein
MDNIQNHINNKKKVFYILHICISDSAYGMGVSEQKGNTIHVHMYFDFVVNTI